MVVFEFVVDLDGLKMIVVIVIVVSGVAGKESKVRPKEVAGICRGESLDAAKEFILAECWPRASSKRTTSG